MLLRIWKKHALKEDEKSMFWGKGKTWFQNQENEEKFGFWFLGGFGVWWWKDGLQGFMVDKNMLLRIWTKHAFKEQEKT